MDSRDVAMAPLRAAVERKRQETRRMKVLLRVGQVAVRVKARERAMLRRKKTALLAKEDAKQKLFDDCMVFLEANEQNGEGNDRYFDEKAMKDAILTLMISDDGGHGGANGGLAVENGDTIHEIGPDLEAKATADVIVAKDSDDGDNNGGLSGDNGGINNAAPETAKNLGEEARMAAVKGTKSDASTDDGGNAGDWVVVRVTSTVITIVVLVLVLLGWLLLESRD